MGAGYSNKEQGTRKVGEGGTGNGKLGTRETRNGEGGGIDLRVETRRFAE
jgi:hypothetical protein